MLNSCNSKIDKVIAKPKGIACSRFLSTGCILHRKSKNRQKKCHINTGASEQRVVIPQLHTTSQSMSRHPPGPPNPRCHNGAWEKAIHQDRAQCSHVMYHWTHSLPMRPHHGRAPLHQNTNGHEQGECQWSKEPKSDRVTQRVPHCSIRCLQNQSRLLDQNQRAIKSRLKIARMQ
jgi:hypothetical protein